MPALLAWTCARPPNAHCPQLGRIQLVKKSKTAYTPGVATVGETSRLSAGIATCVSPCFCVKP